MPTASPSLDSTTLTLGSGVGVFGVRHLSPGGAWHLRQFLDERKPTVVLIEGLSDAEELIPDIVRRDSEPPLAILAYTDSLPVRTLVYPLAQYSPEYQALKWASQHKARAEFIDLPSNIFLALQDLEHEAAKCRHEKPSEESDGEEADEDSSEGPDAVDPEAPQPVEESADQSPVVPPISIYDRFAQAAGEPDYETYWERRFEHNLSVDNYRQTSFRFGEIGRAHV